METFAPVLEKRDPELLEAARTEIAAVEAGLAPYRRGAGWAPYTKLSDADRDVLTARLGALAETLSRLPKALGLS